MGRECRNGEESAIPRKNAAEGYYAGLPGTAYAKILQEIRTEVTPTGAYWNPTRVLSDKGGGRQAGGEDEVIVFASDRTEADDLRRIAPDGADFSRITTHSGPPAYIEPSWSPDGLVT